MRLCFVVPRYGPDVVGGAETLVRDFAVRLSAAGHSVDVLTTCASNHFTWRNDLPPGSVEMSGVSVHRFPVTRARNEDQMIGLEAQIGAGGSLSPEQERDWVLNTGFSEPMMEEISRRAGGVDALIFAPYLFASTCFGAAVRPERSLVIPCLHDEAYARFGVLRETLSGVAGLIFNSDGERKLAQRLLPVLPAHRVVGVGFDVPATRPTGGDAAGVNGADYVAYAGRREAGKNWPLLMEWMTIYSQALTWLTPAKLVSMGGSAVHAPKLSAGLIHDLGYADEGRKAAVLAGAVATAQLSRNESFSYVLFESWLAGTPVVVHADCAVTRGHCAESNGGLWAADAEEFAEVLDRLRRDPGLREGLARQGRRYTEAQYSWSAVLGRFEEAVGALV
jgi:glycosyltransferase involved in cell wall biosynthesis